MAEREVFFLKHFLSITAGMVNLLIGEAALKNPLKPIITDFFVGSVSRTLLESVAVEIEQLYYRTWKGIRDAIPIAIYTAFDFDLEPAAAATGNVTFTEAIGATGIITVPLGTQVQTSNGTVFKTIQVGSFDSAIADDVTIPVIALIPGVAGNVAAGSITFKRSSIPGIGTITNSQPTLGGQEEESESDRKQRFQDFVTNLTRATRRANEVGAETAQLTDPITEAILERVTHSRVYEPFNITDNTVPNGGDGLPATYDVGKFEIYIDNGSGTVSDDLKDEAQRVIDGYDEEGERVAGWKGAGIVGTVLKITGVDQNVTATILMQPSFPFTTAEQDLAEDAVTEYFNNLDILEKISYENIIVAISNASPNFKEVTLTVPSADVSIDYNERAILGSMNITEEV